MGTIVNLGDLGYKYELYENENEQVAVLADDPEEALTTLGREVSLDIVPDSYLKTYNVVRCDECGVVCGKDHVQHSVDGEAFCEMCAEEKWDSKPEQLLAQFVEDIHESLGKHTDDVIAVRVYFNNFVNMLLSDDMISDEFADTWDIKVEPGREVKIRAV